jgi:hypothetical protein
MDLLQTKINDARKLLSEESRDSIDSISWRSILGGIDPKYNPGQIASLEIETELLLCGLINPDNYPKELEARMQISSGEVSLLINKIDERIFKKIQEELQRRLGMGDKIPSKVIKPLVLDSRFSNLPKSIQEAIAKSNWKEKLYEIAPRYKLNIEQMGLLEEITTKMMTDAIHPDQYESEIASQIKIEGGEISNLIKDVNEKILMKIRELEKDSSKEKVVSSKDEEIPLPPYVTSRKEQVVSSKDLNSSKQQVVSSKGNAEMPKNIMEEKMKGPVVSERVVSNHSTPRINDPYHEAI